MKFNRDVVVGAIGANAHQAARRVRRDKVHDSGKGGIQGGSIKEPDGEGAACPE